MSLRSLWCVAGVSRVFVGGISGVRVPQGHLGGVLGLSQGYIRCVFGCFF